MSTSSPWAALLLTLGLVPLCAASASSYTVQKGDSFSSIAAEQLNDAGRWREIWSLNPQIRTPRQLQPGTRLSLPSTGTLQESPQTPQASDGMETDPVQVMAQDLIRSGHIDRMRTDYRLLDTRAPELLAHIIRTEANEEYFYVRGLATSAAEGTLYGLFKPSLEPAGDSFTELIRIGQARLVQQQGYEARLRVIESLKQPLNQVQVLPMHLQPLKIRPSFPETPINARISKALYEQPGGYLLLLNQGRQAGIRAGHLLNYTKTPPPEAGQAESSGGAQRAQGDGWMLVIDTSRDASLALVIQARRIPAVGDRVH